MVMTTMTILIIIEVGHMDGVIIREEVMANKIVEITVIDTKVVRNTVQDLIMMMAMMKIITKTIMEAMTKKNMVDLEYFMMEVMVED